MYNFNLIYKYACKTNSDDCYKLVRALIFYHKKLTVHTTQLKLQENVTETIKLKSIFSFELFLVADKYLLTFLNNTLGDH